MSIQPESREIPSALLLRESLHQFGQTTALVSSNSMAPLLRQGDKIIIVDTQWVSLQTGDIVVMQAKQDLIAHRYWGSQQANEEYLLITRGDRLASFDPLMPESFLVGRVAGRVRNQRAISLSKAPGSTVNRLLLKLLRLEIKMIGQSMPNDAQLIPEQVESNKSGQFERRIIHGLFFFLARLLVLFIEPIGKAENDLN